MGSRICYTSNLNLDSIIGNFGKQPLKEVFLVSHPELARSFQGPNAVRQFQDACGMEINTKASIMFTHNDLVSPNIILSLGQNPKAAAIIDWAQAGWYPTYWEYCKARRVRVDPYYFDNTVQEEWFTKYLPRNLDPADDETYYYP